MVQDAVSPKPVHVFEDALGLQAFQIGRLGESGGDKEGGSDEQSADVHRKHRETHPSLRVFKLFLPAYGATIRSRM